MLRGKIALKKLTLTKHNLKTDLVGVTNRLNKETLKAEQQWTHWQAKNFTKGLFFSLF